jgi:peptidoglycan/LPS O-acetylase OafA/YrhL
MFLVAKIIAKFNLDQSSVMIAWGSVFLSLLFSVGISLASYHFFEKWFLNLKDRFAVIVKG